MAEKRVINPLTKYCFLRYNSRLREAIKVRMKQRGFPHKTLADKYGINVEFLRLYLNSDDPKMWRKISQFAVIKICNELGIEIELTFKIREDSLNDFIRKRDARL